MSQLKLGLTLWSHNHWQHSFYGKGTQPSERLEKYAQVFNTVEGNTTFYASPAAATVANWHSATPDDFRFTFKLPQLITHKKALRHCQSDLSDFIRLLEPLHEKIGQWTIQLPAHFSPYQLEDLQAFCRLFPADFSLGIEVRDMAFFDKGDEEKRFNRWLIESGHNRVIMDSRPLFSALPLSDAIIDAQQKKPRVPVHAIATADRPMIRFIGHPDLNENLAFFHPWLEKLSGWLAEGKTPYLMIHTPDNVQAPELSVKLYKKLAEVTPLPSLPPFPADTDDQQISMF